MTNNDVLKKLRVALKLRDDDIIEILNLVEFKVTKTELSAIFRKEDHPNYVECGDQLLRNFLNGLIVKMRGEFKEDGETSQPTAQPMAKPQKPLVKLRPKTASEKPKGFSKPSKPFSKPNIEKPFKVIRNGKFGKIV